MGDKNRSSAQFAEEFAKLSQTDQAAFSRIANKLLNRTFVVKTLKADNPDYFFISEHRDMFDSWFDIIDYEMVHDVANGFHWIRTTMDHGRLRLSKFDTALILVLRLLYHVKSKEVTSQDKIEVSLADIVDRFRTGKFFGDDKKMTYFDQSLRMLRSRMIVDFRCTRLNDSVNIRILPTILAVVPADGMEDLIKRLESLKAEKTYGEDGDDNEGEEDEDLT